MNFYLYILHTILYKFQFTTGDCKKWLVVNKNDLIGGDGNKFYNTKQITVQKSFFKSNNYMVRIARRKKHLAEPWVIIGDGKNFLYGGNARKDKISYVKNNHGAYVFIKDSKINYNIQVL